MENKQTLNNKKILIVDDEIDILESLEDLLDDMFMVDSASSLRRLLPALKTTPMMSPY